MNIQHQIFRRRLKKNVNIFNGEDKTNWTFGFCFFVFCFLFRVGGRRVDQFKISESEIRIDVHCPSKLRQKRLVEYLLNRNFVPFAPCNCDPRVKVVDFGRA
jgi:hypothetical protein